MRRRSPSFAVRLLLVKKPIERWISATRSLNTGPHRLEHQLGVFRLHGVAFEVLGLGEGELQLFGQRLVKWLPPIGMLRCQTRKPSVITRSVVSVPSDNTTFEGGGFARSYDSKLLIWSKQMKL